MTANLAAARALLVARFREAQEMSNQLEAARLAGVVVGLWSALGLEGEPWR